MSNHTLDNTKTLLKARELGSPWSSFEAYEADDLTNEQLNWSVSDKEAASSLATMINETYQKRHDVLKSIQLNFTEGLGFVVEHAPLLIIQVEGGLVLPLFLDEFWNGDTKAGEKPKNFELLGVERLIFVASFNKHKLSQVQRVFKQARWSQEMLLSDFERRFLVKRDKVRLIPVRQAQYDIFCYILNFIRKDPGKVKTALAHQNHPEVLLEIYHKIETMQFDEVVGKITQLFIGSSSLRGDLWKKPLVERLEYAGVQYAQALLRACVEFIARDSSLVLPLKKEEDTPIEIPALMQEYEKFARVVLPKSTTNKTKKQAYDSPVVFQRIQPSEDYVTDYERSLEELIRIALLLERTLFKGAEQGIKAAEKLTEKFPAGEIASRIIARFLTILHQKQAVYEYEDVRSSTGLAGVLVFFDDDFIDLATTLMNEPDMKHEDLLSVVSRINLHAICARVSQLVKDQGLVEYLHALKDQPDVRTLLGLQLIGQPRTYDGQKCPILNIRRKGDGYELKGDPSLLKLSRYWVMANLPFNDAQLLFLRNKMIHAKDVPLTVLYSIPKPVMPLEESRYQILLNLLENKGDIPHPAYSYRKFLVGNSTTQEQLINFDKTQKLPIKAEGQPILKNCIIAGDGNYVVQRVDYDPVRSNKVAAFIEDFLEEFLESTHQMMICDLKQYRDLVSFYRSPDKNPEAEYFMSLPSEQWKAVYIYYKQLELQSVSDKQAEISFKQILRYLEYLLRGYVALPFFIVRSKGKPSSLGHLLGITDLGLLHDMFDNTQQMVLIINKQLPPFSLLGFDAVKAINTIVSGGLSDNIRSDVIHRQKLSEILDKVYDEKPSGTTPLQVQKQDKELQNVSFFRGEFLVSLSEFVIGGDGDPQQVVPIRQLQGGDVEKVVEMSEFIDTISPFFDLLPKLDNQVLIIPIEKTKGYSMESPMLR